MRASVLCSLIVLSTGCGSSLSSSVFDDPTLGVDGGAFDAGDGADTNPRTDSASGADGSATDTGAPAADTGAPDTSPAPTTLDNVCDRLAKAICTKKLDACCTGKGVTYSETNCRHNIQTSCAAQVDAVKMGDLTFDAGAFPACASAWDQLATKCSIPILDYVRTYAACDQLFNGKVDPGGDCTKDAECRAAPGHYVHCSTSANRCESFSISASGKPCGYTMATAAICDYGLQCQPSTSMGTCKTAKSVGAMCAQDGECGFGNYCNKVGFGMFGTCTPGLPASAPCSSDASCASGACAMGACSDPNAELASPALCGG